MAERSFRVKNSLIVKDVEIDTSSSSADKVLRHDGTKYVPVNILSSTNPVALGNVAVGTSNVAAKSDHVHPTTGLAVLGSNNAFTGHNKFIVTPTPEGQALEDAVVWIEADNVNNAIALLVTSNTSGSSNPLFYVTTESSGPHSGTFSAFDMNMGGIRILGADYINTKSIKIVTTPNVQSLYSDSYIFIGGGQSSPEQCISITQDGSIYGIDLYSDTSVLPIHADNIGGNISSITGDGTYIEITTSNNHNLSSLVQWVYVLGADPASFNGVYYVYDSYTDPNKIICSSTNTDTYVSGGNVFIPAKFAIQSITPSQTTAVLRATTDQTANIQEWKNSSGDIVASIGPQGDMLISNPLTTGTGPALRIITDDTNDEYRQTWEVNGPNGAEIIGYVNGGGSTGGAWFRDRIMTDGYLLANQIFFDTPYTDRNVVIINVPTGYTEKPIHITKDYSDIAYIDSNGAAYFNNSISGSNAFTAFPSSSTLTIGRTDNAVSTINISTAATTTGNDKVINIGTGAVSGNTTITIGSNVAGSTTLRSPTLTVSGNATITGNLTVNGTTTTVNSTTITVDDPIITLGGDTAPASDDNKDRGIEFRWHNGTSAKVGFFGYDDSTGKLTFIPDATNTSEVFSGALGTVSVGAVEALSGTVTARASGAQDGVILQGRAGGTSTYSVSLTPATLSANRTLTLPDRTGTIITSADTGTVTLGMIAGAAWTSWTPALTATTTNPTGSGGNGLYQKISRTVIAKGEITFSGTPTQGTGTYLISLPVTSATTGWAVGDVIGTWSFYDASTGASYSGVMLWYNSTNAFVSYNAVIDTGGGVYSMRSYDWSSTNRPVNFAASDEAKFCIQYEAAS